MEELPKTFRDALFVTSHLAIGYIWIDSLCIFQDDYEDWQREAAAVCDTYTHAVCNIAATNANDSSGGLFFERRPAAEDPFQSYLNCTIVQRDTDGLSSDRLSHYHGEFWFVVKDHWEKDLELAPLNRRAWVMQERFLSPRVLHFSRSQIFWECLEITAGEMFPLGIPKLLKPYWMYDSQLLKRLFSRTKEFSQKKG